MEWHTKAALIAAVSVTAACTGDAVDVCGFEGESQSAIVAAPGAEQVNEAQGQKADLKARTVRDLYLKLGAPTEVVDAGDKKFYRWAANSDDATSECGDLLVATSLNGTILETQRPGSTVTISNPGIIVLDVPH